MVVGCLLRFFFLLLISPVFAKAPEVVIPNLDFKPPQGERFQLKNGAVVYVMEDHELPLFMLRVRMKVTPADEIVPDAFGFFGTVWRTGGTKKRPPDDLNEELERAAISIETTADNESITLTLECLSRDMNKSLEIVTDLLVNPAFDGQQLSLTRAKTLESLRRKNETPNQIARRAFRDVVYGAEHAYAQEPTEKDVARISRADLLEIHKRTVQPDLAVIAVAGAFKKEELIARLEQLFAAWPAAGRSVPAYDFSLKSPSTGTVFFVEKDANQSRITMGRVGPARHNADHFSLLLADYILGSGGPSRLFGEIRSRLGLAYVVGSFLQEPAGPGLIGVGCQTKAASTIAAVQAIQAELDAFRANGARPDEIAVAKESTINSYVFGFDSPWDVVNVRASNEFFGFAPDYPDTAAARIRAVTQADIARVAKQYYGRESWKILVVGDEKKFGAPMETLGAVTRIPLEAIP